jgi:hypothetical protein
MPLAGHWSTWSPGPIHEGNGGCLAVIDDAPTRLSAQHFDHPLGHETAPGATIFNVFASTFATVHPPRFRPIALGDIAARVSHLPSQAWPKGTGPIVNPITGQPHRVRVVMPDGLYPGGLPRAARAGIVTLDWGSGHAHLCTMHMTPQGPVG